MKKQISVRRTYLLNMNINQSKRNNNKSTEDEPSIKGNVRAQERCREEAGRGSMRESMSLRDIQ